MQTYEHVDLSSLSREQLIAVVKSLQSQIKELKSKSTTTTPFSLVITANHKYLTKDDYKIQGSFIPHQIFIFGRHPFSLCNPVTQTSSSENCILLADFFNERKFQIRNILSNDDICVFFSYDGLVYWIPNRQEKSLIFPKKFHSTETFTILKSFSHYFHTTSGTVYFCSRSSENQLIIQPILQNIIFFSTGTRFTLIQQKNGDICFCEHEGYIFHKPSVRLKLLMKSKGKLKKIAHGWKFVILLFDDGTVWGFGNNEEGQLAMSETVPFFSKPIQIFIPHDSKEKSIKCFPIIDVEAGDTHSVFLTDCNKIFVTGYNSHGQLGIENCTLAYYATELELKSLKKPYKVSKILCGNNFTFIVIDDERVICFGRNHLYQLGVMHKANPLYEEIDYGKIMHPEILNLSYESYITKSKTLDTSQYLFNSSSKETRIIDLITGTDEYNVIVTHTKTESQGKDKKIHGSFGIQYNDDDKSNSNNPYDIGKKETNSNNRGSTGVIKHSKFVSESKEKMESHYDSMFSL